MNYEELKTEYTEYLMNRAGLEKDGDEGYGDICAKLMETDFIPINEMDENRTYDCYLLRKDFEADSLIEWAGDILEGVLGDNGTMLELLIVMAEKMKFELSDSEYDASTRKWILELMDNCGLSYYAKNSDYQKEGSVKEVEDILDTVIFRTIGWDGEGGLFPVYLSQRDQRKVELIAQMNDYIEENYDI